MKKVILTIVLALLTTIFAGAPKAEAAWGGWETSDKGVSSRVYVDAYSYSTKASTIDYKAEKKGNTTYYYRASLYKQTSSSITEVAYSTGSFKTSSPLKSFKLYEVRKHGSGVYFIRFKLYSNSSRTNLVGLSDSHNFTVLTGA